MRVLVIGSGAREHALVARIARDLPAGDILCAPGNPGIGALVRTLDADIADSASLIALAARESIDFTIVGPELPLSLGLVDRFVDEGRLIFGPTKAAARLESSKAFAKAFMVRHGVPTARFEICETAEDALSVVRSGGFGFPVVLKADGLAAGKGVVIAGNLAEAEQAISAAMSERRFGEAGARLVIEECLTGPEVSFFAICDGQRALSIGTAQDHKRIFDGDLGPNTGGMGAFAPSPLVHAGLSARVMLEIVDPVVAGMAEEGHPFRGFLYVGLMLTPEGPKVIEFNVRLGDPEAQVILPLIDSPFVPLLASAASGALQTVTCELSPDKIVGVVLASRGYPLSSESGRTISGVGEAEKAGVRVLHAGTAVKDGALVTAGGRVLTVVARGTEYEDAITRAYAGVDLLRFDGMQYRRDIGRKALSGAHPPR
jgi:phosphoribosylamine--glycine ligase